MKQLFISILIVLCFCKCTKNNTKLGIDNADITKSYSHFSRTLEQDYFKTKFDENWYNRSFDQIRKVNSTYSIEQDDRIEYIVVPSLCIPADSLNSNNLNILSYTNKGELTLNNSELLVFKNDTLQVKFLITDGISKTRDGLSKCDFNTYLKGTTIQQFKKADLYFKITITDSLRMFPIPGTILSVKNNYMVIDSDGTTMPIDKMHEILFKSPSAFEKHISNIIKMTRK